MDKIENLPPFKRFCMTIGELPTSYVASMTYAECVVWLCNYLKNTVVPAVNENAEAVNELIDWFNNLEVQDEIDTKLDEMVEDGTLAEIINQEVFGEISARIEEVNSNLSDEIDLINSGNTVIIGDSYSTGDNPNDDSLTTWSTMIKNFIQAEDATNEVTILHEEGSGFLRAGTYNHTFLQLLQANISSITNKNSIKNVILCGGYNDNTYSLSDIRTAIVTFVNYCYTQFPNSTVYIGEIGYRNEVSSSGASTRDSIAYKVYPAYANNVSSNVLTRPYVYLNGVESILKSIPKTYMYSDNAHPNQNGQNALGVGIYQAFKTGCVNPYSSSSLTVTNSSASNISQNINVRHNGGVCTIAISNLKITFPSDSTFTVGTGETTIGTYTCNGFIGGIANQFNVIHTHCSIQDYNKGRHVLPCYIMFDTSGNVKLHVWETITTTSTGTSNSFPNTKEIEIFKGVTTISDIVA